MGNLFKDAFNMEETITVEKREVEFGLKSGKITIIVVEEEEVNEILIYYRGFIKGTFKDEVIAYEGIRFSYSSIEYIKLNGFVTEKRRVPIKEVF